MSQPMNSYQSMGYMQNNNVRECQKEDEIDIIIFFLFFLIKKLKKISLEEKINIKKTEQTCSQNFINKKI